VRVLINATTTLQHKTSVGHYVAELIRGLRGIDPDCVRTYPSRREVLVMRWWHRQSRLYEESVRTPGRWAYVRRRLRGKFLALLRKTPLAPYTDRVRNGLSGCDLYHEPNYVPSECDGPVVVTLQDLSALHHPEWHLPVWAAHFQEHFLPRLRGVNHLIALSEFGKRQIVRHLGWPPDRISVTPPGVRPGLRRIRGMDLDIRLKILGLKVGYFLHVGTLEPRKNLAMLLGAYRDLPASVREHAPLVLVGAPGWNVPDLEAYLRDGAKGDNVRWMNYVDDMHFSTLYSGAKALLLPSLHEGFGMPAVEMMAVGGAVLASSAGALPETTAGGAHLIDPNDQDAWRDAMLRVYRDREWRFGLRQGAREIAERYTWERCAELTLGAYRRALKPARAAGMTEGLRAAA
jgi:alpha-1,3-rhamnosyl/mannosyltransferase